jgi:hypothetical protein
MSHMHYFYETCAIPYGRRALPLFTELPGVRVLGNPALSCVDIDCAVRKYLHAVKQLFLTGFEFRLGYDARLFELCKFPDLGRHTFFCNSRCCSFV